MISNQILQNTIDGLKNIARADLGIYDTEGMIIAATFEETSAYKDEVVAFADSAAENQEMNGCQFFRVSDESRVEYILIVKGSGNDIYIIGKMAAFQIQSLLVAYKERFDKENFIKNLLLDNLLLVDIYNRSKKLHIETNIRRVVYIVETSREKDSNAMETLRTLFSSKGKDFITAVDEKNIIIVKELKENEGYSDVEKTANVILDMLNTEAMANVHVAYGTIISEIKEMSNQLLSPWD